MQNLTKGLRTLLCPIVFTAVLAPSCKKADVQAPEQAISEAHVTELKTFISSSMQLKPTQISFSGKDKTFTIAGDGKMTLEDAENHMKKAAGMDLPGTATGIAHRVNNYTISPTNATDITIYVDPVISADWSAVIDQAIANWNNTNSKLQMRRVATASWTATTQTAVGNGPKPKKFKSTTTTEYADVKVLSYYDNATNQIAYGYYPTSLSTPGQEIDINNYYSYLTTGQKVFAITHEIGHVVGFTHTDGSYGSLINGTPLTDPSSVMNSFCLSWTSFTDNDLTAIKIVYPK